ncbi:hypothetical protein [Actinomadura algeriensis]|uniref:Secreted protein n=1 Tax=Actinomadura algeriensis TaxID=1679523 RepID=A0ABR9JUP1_9ACTN|nr:hypothetical protein [Actinomadura algeriensis]MBE1534208.1 hypothetical protein [Actinomadura algeriensis]
MMIFQRPARAAGIPVAALVAIVPGAAHAPARASAPAAARASAPAAAHVSAPAAARGDVALRHASTSGSLLRALDDRLRRSDVNAVLEASGARELGAQWCGKDAAVPPGSLTHCFDRKDSRTKRWVPQGVTTVSDAVAGENWNGARPLLVSWHGGERVRVSFVDPDGRTYRHVLLVAPAGKKGRATFRDLGVHAGGIAWFEDKLYVADTTRGFRVFDMTRIYDLGASKAGSTKHAKRVGLHSGKYYGHGHRYVMPQVGTWRYVEGRAPSGTCRGKGPLRTSWTSIDRTSWPPSLIAGEYCGAGKPRGRVAAWPLGDGGPAASGGVARASRVAAMPGDQIQGAVRTNGLWWFTRGRGPDERGEMLVTRPGVFGGWDRVTRHTVSYGPEDLSCQRGASRIWTVAEYAGRRALWGLPASACH